MFSDHYEMSKVFHLPNTFAMTGQVPCLSDKDAKVGHKYALQSYDKCRSWRSASNVSIEQKVVVVC